MSTHVEWLQKELEKYDKNNPDPNCWLWPWAKDRNGYGYVWIEGRLLLVHRLVAAKFHGLNLNNHREVAMHKCDFPPCFNPDHIKKGSYGENTSDAARKRPLPQLCPSGHQMTPENIYTHSDHRARPGCLICKREQTRKASAKYYARKREQTSHVNN